ncbi:DUF5302 domain-containing protein [Streptomyces sp. ST2-7A]|uniref:DUF5302 domain-containing protein n=1 Tax=Streptomyces sp. ST2-7A TaxID=2907214 RepID=UPI001F403B15|nr:DUF5302 domain-containing protein [Streptomyces sp. ST2-7A]MCE7082936.1 DUF5302 domain-containing protein [Streptomyces sp. ST2-7A]
MTDIPKNNATDDDAKRKFQEALARKNLDTASRTAHGNVPARTKGGSNPAGGKRNFRRKTG